VTAKKQNKQALYVEKCLN